MLRCRVLSGVALAGALLLGIGWSGVPAPVVVENRPLAQWPEWAQLTRNSAAWRAAVDAWVTDNFPARRHLIGGLNYLRWRLGYSGSSRVVVGEGGWLFYDDGTHLGQVRPSTLTEADLAAWTREMQARTEYLRVTGTPYLVFAAPVKESLYRDRVPRFLERPGTTNAQASDAAARGVGQDNYLDLHPGLMKAKDAGVPIFSPYETHWTGEGAYVAYVEVVHALARSGLHAEPLPRAAFRLQPPGTAPAPQDLANMLGIASFVRQEYPQLVSPDAAPSTVTWLGASRDWTADRVIDTGVTGPVLLLTGDSFSTALVPLLERSFSRIVFSHHQNGFFRRDLVERFKPDAVLLEVIESGIRHAMPPLSGKP